MKKDEFFAQLRTAFAGMDEELLTDILGDYENHFKERIENGKSGCYDNKCQFKFGRSG